MPEYLAPGVYVEEVSFRAKSIEGVPTSTTGYAGMTAFGPVYFQGAPKESEPRLVTSYADFERTYGGLTSLRPDGEERVNYLAHAVRAFFLNGGRRLYVSRVFVPLNDGSQPDDRGVARLAFSVGNTSAAWRARWPGAMGNVAVEVSAVRSKNVNYKHSLFGPQAQRAKAGSIVEISRGATEPVKDGVPLVKSRLYLVEVSADGKQTFKQGNSEVSLADNDMVQLVELRVLVKVNSERIDAYDELGTDPRQKRYIGRILSKDDPEDENAVVWLDAEPGPGAAADYPVELMIALVGNTTKRLDKGHDGRLATGSDLKGKEANQDNPAIKATGLEALAEIDDIAIVALPDAGALSLDECKAAADALITHAETCRYRIAVIDGPLGSSMNQIRRFRGQFDSKYAALYHPWIEILDPNERAAQGAPPRKLLLPPSGFVTGIYARSDIERGVHKAPANEVVRGLTKLEANINRGRQDVLNPEGINALRFFEGRGNRVWGARTISSDPEWKYVNVRRLFIYLEHSIDKGTQWAVFEPNNDRLWRNVKQTVEDFLLVLWRDGALLGRKPEEAYFVRCDRTTMTQNDLDNGRLICEVGVAPVKPAEFVIFRIGQWTANAKVN